MTNSIVVVNVSQVAAPAPNTLQKTGAFVSQGGTTTAAGTQTLLTQASDLTAVVRPAAALTSLAWSGSVVTAIAAAPHGFGSSGTLWITITGAVPAAYNGTFLATVTTNAHFTYALASDPGAETTPGSYNTTSAVELTQMVTTFFDQGSGQAVYINELGFGSPAQGVTALAAWITANPAVYYLYLVPRAWSGEATFLTFVANFESLTSKVFFFTTMTTSNYTSFTTAMNCVLGLVEAPVVAAANSGTGNTGPGTEFSLAAAFYVVLNYNPTGTNKVTPLAFSFLFGVTPYPIPGNGTLLAQFKAAGVNYVGTGAEGGISNTILFWGLTMDLRQFNYWYSVDWVQINVDLDVSNAVINGSNNPSNPLYLNQDGVNRLQAVAARTLTRGVSFGLVFGKVVQSALLPAAFTQAFDNAAFAGQAVVNADPFTDYYTTNPSDYRNGIYGGFSVVYTPQLGFQQVIFDVSVTDFVVG